MKTSVDPRHLARKIAISVEYALSNGANNSEQEILNLIDTTKDSLSISTYDNKLLLNLLDIINVNRLVIDSSIKANCKDWDVEKMYKMDLSILIVATAELMYTLTPAKVIVDEAVELAKEFGSSESSKFINGVLAGIINSIETKEKEQK